jgi:hypothetical protein
MVRYKDDFNIFGAILDEICKIRAVLRPITAAATMLNGKINGTKGLFCASYFFRL